MPFQDEAGIHDAQTPESKPTTIQRSPLMLMVFAMAGFDAGIEKNLNSILGTVVNYLILGATVGLLISAIASVVSNFTIADFGDPTVNTIANTVFPLLIAFVGLFAVYKRFKSAS